jgi:hypothetical protein
MASGPVSLVYAHGRVVFSGASEDGGPVGARPVVHGGEWAGVCCYKRRSSKTCIAPRARAFRQGQGELDEHDRREHRGAA